jgi:hypothetical protein
MHLPLSLVERIGVDSGQPQDGMFPFQVGNSTADRCSDKEGSGMALETLLFVQTPEARIPGDSDRILVAIILTRVNHEPQSQRVSGLGPTSCM